MVDIVIIYVCVIELVNSLMGYLYNLVNLKLMYEKSMFV